MVIPICQERVNLVDNRINYLGFTGFGLIFTMCFTFHKHPQEAIFKESTFASPSQPTFDFCRDENVCVETVTFPEPNICHFDDGGLCAMYIRLMLNSFRKL